MNILKPQLANISERRITHIWYVLDFWENNDYFVHLPSVCFPYGWKPMVNALTQWKRSSYTMSTSDERTHPVNTYKIHILKQWWTHLPSEHASAPLLPSPGVVLSALHCVHTGSTLCFLYVPTSHGTQSPSGFNSSPLSQSSGDRNILSYTHCCKSGWLLSACTMFTIKIKRHKQFTIKTGPVSTEKYIFLYTVFDQRLSKQLQLRSFIYQLC